MYIRSVGLSDHLAVEVMGAEWSVDAIYDCAFQVFLTAVLVCSMILLCLPMLELTLWSVKGKSTDLECSLSNSGFSCVQVATEAMATKVGTRVVAMEIMAMVTRVGYFYLCSLALDENVYFLY